LARLLKGMHEINNDLYDLYLIDLWGVIHDGEHIFNEAKECLYQLLDLKKTIVFLSNSPKRSYIIQNHLQKMGLPKNLKYTIYTSGEYAYKELNSNRITRKNETKIKAFFLGPSHHEKFKEGLPFEFVRDITNSNLIINTGFIREGDKIENYQDILELAKAKNLTLHCINPDFFAIDCGRKILCAGLIADKYQALEGTVIYYGKPHSPIYHSIYNQYKIPKGRMLAIGDSLYSDIKGAKSFGIASVLILSGIHAMNADCLSLNTSKITEKAQALFKEKNISPNYMMMHFKW